VPAGYLLRVSSGVARAGGHRDRLPCRGSGHARGGVGTEPGGRRTFGSPPVEVDVATARASRAKHYARLRPAIREDPNRFRVAQRKS